MRSGLALRPRRVLLAAAMVAVLTLVMGVSGLACGGDGSSPERTEISRDDEERDEDSGGERKRKSVSEEVIKVEPTRTALQLIQQADKPTATPVRASATRQALTVPAVARQPALSPTPTPAHATFTPTGTPTQVPALAPSATPELQDTKPPSPTPVPTEAPPVATPQPPTPELSTSPPTSTPIAPTATPSPTPDPTPSSYWASNYGHMLLIGSPRIQMWDVSAFRNGVPRAKAQELFNAIWDAPENYQDHYFSQYNSGVAAPVPFGIGKFVTVDQVNRMAVNARGSHYLGDIQSVIVEGPFDFERIRRDLERANFAEESIGIYEVWNADGYNRVPIEAIAIIESDSIVVMTFNRGDMHLFLDRYGGNRDLEGSQRNLAQALDRVGQGWYLLGDFEAAMSISNGDGEHSVKITCSKRFDNEDRSAYVGQRLSKTEYIHDHFKVEDVKTEAHFVTSEVSTHENNLGLQSLPYFCDDILD